MTDERTQTSLLTFHKLKSWMTNRIFSPSTASLVSKHTMLVGYFKNTRLSKHYITFYYLVI